MHLQEIQAKVDRLRVQHSTAKQTLIDTKVKLRKAKHALTSTTEAQKVCQLVAASVQQRAHHRIAAVVTRCLAAVFDEPYEFQIVFERKRGRTEANLTFTRDGHSVNPMDSSGGGVVDVGAFALRLSCLLLNRPPLRKVLILDEPFRFVSEEYQGRVATLLETLAKELQVQIIMVTHNRKYQIGKTIRL